MEAIIVLSPLVNGIVRKVKSLITSEISFAPNLIEQLSKVEGAVTTVQGVLLAAEEKKDVAVREWLKGLHDVLYDVDDLLDDISTEDLRRQEEDLHGNIRKSVCCFVSRTNLILLTSKFTRRFEDVGKRLAYFSIEMQRFDFLVTLSPDVEDTGRVKEHAQPFIYWSRVVGRDQEKRTIIDFLTESHSKPAVVTVLGTRGTGKTTLAELVCNDEKVRTHFSPLLRTNVHNHFDLNTIFEDLLELDHEHRGLLSKEDLQMRLRKELERKKSLVVLDDIGNLTPEQCQELRDLLKVGIAGVLIATTDQCIADLVGESFISCDEKWNEEAEEQITKFLLNKSEEKLSTFSIVGIMHPNNTLLESICNDERVKSEFEDRMSVRISCDEFNLEKIVECILGEEDTDKTLEKLQIELRKKLRKKFLLVLEDLPDVNPYQWDKLRVLLTNDEVGNKVLITAHDKQVALAADAKIELESLYAHLKIHLEPLYVNDTHENIVDILRFNFDTLPSSMKLCFVYSMCFPVKPPDRERLTQQWIAQGFILPSENNQISLEDLANKYFDVLVSRSFFYNLVQDDLVAETRFEVHDLVCRLARSVSEGECSIAPSDQIENISCSVCHVALSNGSKKIPSSLRRLKKLRTLKWENFGCRSTTTFDRSLLSGSLRVLDLSSSEFKQLPSSIGELNHLRYLDLSHNIYLENLPSSFFKLYNLETLRMEECIIQELPRDLKKLKKLRNLYATTEQVSIPEEVICGLTSLRILHLNPVRNLETLPKGLENLKALETLVLKFCSKLSFSENDMKGLTSLRNLTITHLEKEWIIPPGLQDGASLSSLCLFYCVGKTSLPGWLRKLQCLRRLRIEFCPNLTASPEGICLPSGLQYLSIRGSPGLSRRCEREFGEDWQKIAHVQEIYLDGMKIETIPGSGMVGSHKLFEGLATIVRGEGSSAQEDDVQILNDFSHSLTLEPDLESGVKSQSFTKEKIGDERSATIVRGEGSSAQEDDVQTLYGVSQEASLMLEPDLESGVTEPHLRSMILVPGLEDQVQKLRLMDKIGLTGLTLDFHCEGIKDEDGVVEGLQPHHSLEVLRIFSYSGKLLPSWITSLSKLRKLDLDKCTGCDGLPPLGKLSSLEHLSVARMSNLTRIGEDFLGITAVDSDGNIILANATNSPVVAFPKLTELSFYSMEKWEEWEGKLIAKEMEGNKDAKFEIFPRLRKLEIFNCRRLNALPQYIQMAPIEELCIRCSSVELNSWITSSLSKLRKLDLAECTGCDGLPPLGKLSSLEHLSVARMSNLTRIGEDFLGITAVDSDGNIILANATNSPVVAFPKLTELSFYSMEKWEEWEGKLIAKEMEGNKDAKFEIFPRLRKLEIFDCRRLNALPQYIQMAPIEELRIRRCSSVELNSWITSSLSKLRKLDLVECTGCDGLPPLGKLSSLEHLSIARMSNLTRIGEDFLGITTVDSDGNIILANATNSPVVAFPKLTELSFYSMEKWEEWEGKLIAKEMEGNKDAKFEIFPRLRYLDITVCPRLKALPQYIQMAPIEELRIRRCSSVELNSWITSSFSKLRKLDLAECTGYDGLPPLGKLSSLEHLSVARMSNLTRLGEDWTSWELLQ